MHLERTFTVGRPLEETFDYLADFTHSNEWDPGTVETRRTTGNGGVGTRYVNVSEFLGRRVEMAYETLVHDRPLQVQFRGRNDSATATDTLTFVPDAEGTRIHYQADFDFGRFARLVAPAFRSRLERLADDTIAQIQRTLD